jgi:osmoprotectant transport system permease protein
VRYAATVLAEGNILSDALDWLSDPENWSWSGGGEIPHRIVQHVSYSAVAVAIACLIAVPAGTVIGHTRRAEFLAVSVANLGRAIPSFAILSIVYQVMLSIPRTQGIAFGPGPIVVAMFLLSVPPILTNTYVGIQQVDPDTVEAARGMGLTGGQIVRRLELPLAAPLIVTGVRTAAVQVVATVTLAALIAGGGLGRPIVDGLATQDRGQYVGGAILVSLLAIVTEVVFGGIARLAAPRVTSRVERSAGTSVIG